MSKKRKVLITITYNEMGIIVDTKAEEVAQPSAKDTNIPITDTISRQAAIDALCRGEGCGNICRRALERLPSAQPERKKGKWLPDNNNYYEERFICSVCGKSYKVDTCMGKPMWNFCPCGADMRGKQDG